MIFELYKRMESLDGVRKNTNPDDLTGTFDIELAFLDSEKDDTLYMNAFYNGDENKLEIVLLKESIFDRILKEGHINADAFNLIKDAKIKNENARALYKEQYDKVFDLAFDSIIDSTFIFSNERIYK